MKRGIFIVASAIAIAAYAGAADAKSIKSEIPRDALRAFCADAGLGEKTAQFTRADGTVITGTVHCEAEDIQVAEAGDDNGGQGADDPAGDDHGQDADDQNDERGANSGHGDGDNSGPGNSGDDNSGHGSGGDDSSGGGSSGESEDGSHHGGGGDD